MRYTTRALSMTLVVSALLLLVLAVFLPRSEQAEQIEQAEQTPPAPQTFAASPAPEATSEPATSQPKTDNKPPPSPEATRDGDQEAQPVPGMHTTPVPKRLHTIDRIPAEKDNEEAQTDGSTH